MLSAYPFKRKQHISILLIAPIFLLACVPDNEIKTATSAHQQFAHVAQNISSNILLTDPNTYIISLASVDDTLRQDSALSLVSVIPLSTNCPVPSNLNSTQMTYSLFPSQVDVCFYRYTVSFKMRDGTEAQRSAENYVRITNQINDLKPPLSLPHFNFTDDTKQNLPFEIDILTMLQQKKIDLTGKTLGSDVIVLGSDTVKATAPANRTILFTPDGTSTFTRVLYTLQSTKNQQVEAGSIDVFIEQENNSLPVAKNFIYRTNAIIGEEISAINLAKYISDTDDDTLTLSSVSVFNANASLPEKKASSCKTCFNFIAESQGQYQVNYVVSDQRGGYGSGIIKINVQKPWKDITSIKNLRSLSDEIATKQQQQPRQQPLNHEKII